MATATRTKKLVGALLLGLRQRAGVGAAAAAAELKSTVSSVNRYEAGAVVPNWGTVRTLLSFYGASAGEVDQAARLWEEANQEPSSVRLPAAVPGAFRKLVNAEREAVRERELAPCVIPGLLQTRRYAQALEDAAHRFYNPKTRQANVIAARMNRQKPLDGPDPLVLHALIDEAAFRRQVGGPDVLREQLAQLLVLAERPNITLQAIPVEAGAYGTMNGSCIIVDYPEPDATPGVYLEYPAGGAWVDNHDDVHRFTTMFHDTTTLAHTPAQTTNLIHHQIRALADP